MTADLEFGPTGEHGTPPRSVQPVRSPAMRAYCVTLARFTASVQSTEQLLRNDEAGVREDTEQRELTAASRLRGIDRAGLAADDGLDQCAAVRSAHGLPVRDPFPWDDGDSGGSAAGGVGQGFGVDGSANGVPQDLRGVGPGGLTRRIDDHRAGGVSRAADGFGAGGPDGDDRAQRHGAGRAADSFPQGLGTGSPDGDEGWAERLGAGGPVRGVGRAADGLPQGFNASGPYSDDRVQRLGQSGVGRAADGLPQGLNAGSPDGDGRTHSLGAGGPARGAGRTADGIPQGLDAGGPNSDDRTQRLGAGRAASGLPQGFGAGGPDDDGQARRPGPGGPARGAGRATESLPQGFSAGGRAQGLDRLRRSGGGDLGVALTSLGRRRDALRLAEEDFTGWLAAHDERTRRVSIGAAVVAGLAGAAVMAVAGSRTSAATSLALLIACTLAVVAVGLGVAAARRSPQVCRGYGLARRPHPLGLARYGAQVGGLALLALVAVNVAAGAL